MSDIPANTRPLTGRKPRLVVPAGAIDAHFHLYPPGFPQQPGGPPIAETASVEDYRQVQRWLGLERVVLVQANAHQLDPGALLDSLAKFGPVVARGVAAVGPETDPATLERLHAAGVRGARIMELPGGAVKIAQIKAVEALIRPYGWSLTVQCNGQDLEQHLPVLDSIEIPFVIDHMGKFIPPVPADDRRVDAILRQIDRGHVFVKLAGIYETSLIGAPNYDDVAAIIRRLIAHAPERLIWGSNWPHVGVPRSAYPDDAALLDLLADWADTATLHRILVDTPARLYDF